MRQFCAHCLTSTAEYTTESAPDGRKFHYCTDPHACAVRRGAHHGEGPVYRDGGPIDVACQMFLLCDQPAEGIADIAPGGSVPAMVGTIPTCVRCAEKLGHPFTLGRFTIDAAGTTATFIAAE